MQPKSHTSGSGSLLPLALWIALPLIGLTTLFCLLFANGYKVHKENASMENVQMLCVLISSCLFLSTSFRVAGGDRVLNRMIGLFFLTISLRELDVRPFNHPKLTMLAAGTSRNVFLGILWFGAAIYLLRHRESFWLSFRQWMKTVPGRLFIIAAFILSFAVGADKLHYFPKEINMFMEELIEINGYWIVLVGAWCHFVQNRRQTALASG